MADNKKYYYMRLKENFFDSDEMVVLESMPDGYLYSNILLKLYLRSLKSNGKLMLNDRIPYNSTILSAIVRQNVGVVEKALQIFKELGLIEVLDNGAIYMIDIQNYIGKSSTEADRKRDYRNSIETEKAMLGCNDNDKKGQMSRQNSDKSTPEIEIEIEKEIDIEIEKEIKVNYQQIADMYNNTCVSFPRLINLSNKRKQSIRARLKTYNEDDFKRMFELAEHSNFLKGKNSRDWQANFDWMIKDSNMAKILDGNYANKGGSNNGHTRTDDAGTKAESLYDKAVRMGWKPE